MKLSLDTENFEENLKNRLKFGIRENIQYRQKFLQAGATPDDFFKEIAHKIDLEQLYKVEEIQLETTWQSSCPVIVEIVDPYLIQLNDAKYLLQIWNKELKKTFEKPLKSKLSFIGNDGGYLYYLPGALDKENNLLHIQDLKEPTHYIKIANLFSDSNKVKYVCFDHEQNYLIIAKEQEIKYFKLEDAQFETEGEPQIIDANDLVSRTIYPKLKLKGIFEKYFAFETTDNQLDFNRLDLSNFESDDEFTYEFHQYAEIFPRNKADFDPITKVVYKYVSSFSYAISLRQSGKFDLYWDKQKKFSSDFPVDDVDMSISTLYFRLHSEDKQEHIMKIDHQDSRVLGWDMAEEILDKEFQLSKVNYLNSKEFVRIYKDLVVGSSEYNTYTVVAHQQTISLFNMVKNKWTKHVTFSEGHIEHFFELERNDGNLDVVVILESGSTYFLSYDSISNEKKGPLTIDVSQRLFAFDQKIADVKLENINDKYAIVKLIDNEDPNIFHFTVLRDRNRHDIDYKDKETFNSDINFLPVQQCEDGELLILKIDSTSDEQNSLTVYHLNEENDDAEGEAEGEGEGEGEENNEEENNENEEENEEEDTEQHEQTRGNMSASFNQKESETYKKDDYTPTITKINFNAIKTIKKYLEGMGDDGNLIANAHSAVVIKTKKEKKDEEKPPETAEEKKDGEKPKETYKYTFDYLFIVDNVDLYVNQTGKRKIFKKTGLNALNFCFNSNDCTYAICKGPTTLDQGLFYFNLGEVVQNITNDEVKSVPFKNYEVGNNHNLVFCNGEARIGYFNTLTHITVVPFLHTNQIKFIGVNKTSDYVAYKIEADHYYVLNKKGEIQSWNLLSGKFQKESKVKNIEWLANYQNHDPENDGEDVNINRKDKVLLRTKEASPTEKYQDYFEPFQMAQTLDNQKTYIDDLEKKILHWKLIEIQKENIVTHLEFYHPSYEFQHLYISSDFQLMIERQLYSKVYLYKAVSLGENRVKWQLIRKLEDYDRELEAKTMTHVPFYSPDFSYHIAIDRHERQFIIKETITNKIFAHIPKDILTFDMSKPTELPIFAMNRIQWVDNRLLRVVNKQGIEKLIDFQHNFEEVASNTIPGFTMDGVDDDEFNILPYFYERSTLTYEEVEEGLLRKYQMYKSQYYLFNRTDMNSLYATLFNVDKSDLQFSQLSFTFLHWSIIKQIIDNKLQFEDINEAQIQPLLYNIFPGGNTLLHYFCGEDQGDDIVTLVKASLGGATDEYNLSYHIPIIQNIEKQSPLHVAKQVYDYKSIDALLKYLSVYTLDHHSKAIKDLIPHFIEKDLPSLSDYLNSRLQQNEQGKSIVKAKLKDDYEQTFPLELWYLREDFDQRNVDQKAIEKRIKCEFIDLPGAYHYLDPNFQDFFDALAGTENFELFKIKALQKMIDFNFPLVKEYTVRRLLIPYIAFLLTFTTYNNMFAPFYVEAYNNKVEDPDTYNRFFIYDILYLSPLVLFACYFLLNELRQFISTGFGYLLSVWNYIDILPPVGLLTTVVFMFLGSDIVSDSTVRQVAAVTTFFMWIKLMYFLRIFQNTGYLIRMIVTVIYDMRTFFLVLLIGLFAFSDTFLMISLGNPAEPVDDTSGSQFTTGFINSVIYTYSVILGGFDLADYDNSIAYAFVICLFLICTIFNMIVMLNLLIAIISESFANVNSNAKNAMYQEMAAIISENNYLIPDKAKECYAKQNLYLMIITDLEAVEQEFSDPVKNQIADLQSYIEGEMSTVTTKIDDLKKELNFKFAHNTLDFGAVKEKLTEITKTLANMNRKEGEEAVDEDEEYGEEE